MLGPKGTNCIAPSNLHLSSKSANYRARGEQLVRFPAGPDRPKSQKST